VSRMDGWLDGGSAEEGRRGVDKRTARPIRIRIVPMFGLLFNLLAPICATFVAL
jgi:hypothetical protein